MTTLHDNEFGFDIDGLSDVEFIEESHCVTKGQPYEGVSSIKSSYDGSCKLVIKAGRKKSEEVSAWFMDKSHGSEKGLGGCIGKTYTNDYPQKLNFAVRGTLILKIFGIEYRIDNISLAQGSNGTHNNWWIGSPDLIMIKAEKVTEEYSQILSEMSNSLILAGLSRSFARGIKAIGIGIYKLATPHKVGRGIIGCKNDQFENSKAVVFIRMDDTKAHTTLLGTYSLSED